MGKCEECGDVIYSGGFLCPYCEEDRESAELMEDEDYGVLDE